MGERFYKAQLKEIGTCPGHTNKRRKRVAWSDEKRSKAIELYEAAEPTAETSIEIVKDIAEELGEAPNGVRLVLIKAGVYIKKDKAASSTPSESKGTRISKADAIEDLKKSISDAGCEVDDGILDKFTGKAAVYVKSVIDEINQ